MAEKKNTEDFDLNFTQEQFAGLTPHSGAGFQNTKFGDYTVEISDASLQTSKGQKPHNMLNASFRIVKAYDEENASEVGSEISNLYAGSSQSPPFMQKRLKALCLAIDVKHKGTLKRSMFIGKRCDVTIVWELSESDKLDDYGRKKKFINARIKGERHIGEERPKGIDPVRDSREAKAFFDRGGAEGASTAEAPEWEKPAAEPQQADVGFIAEEQVDELGHTYRAVVKLGGEEAAQAREQLINAGIDPDGPINVDLISDSEIKTAYAAKFGGRKPGGLPPLNSGRKTQQPRV